MRNNKVYAVATAAVSALGNTIAEHWQQIEAYRTGIRFQENKEAPEKSYWAAQLLPQQWENINKAYKSSSLTRFERFAVSSIQAALAQNPVCIDDDTLFVLSSTKGNIDLLNKAVDEEVSIINSARKIAKHIGITTNPVIISQACISGVVALQYALRMLKLGRYRQAIVCGCDPFSQFVLSGFQSFQAITNQACKPFDKNRQGLNLGEASACIILSTDPANAGAELLAGSTSNDANHISGPSRTGMELAKTITDTLRYARVNAADIDMISAHGTATPYNDEMESKAFAHAGVLHAPLHSLKSFTGHTLGAAGILESCMIIEAFRKQCLIPSLGFEELGVSQPVNVTTRLQNAALQYVLKTASGFGGCNGSILWGKNK